MFAVVRFRHPKLKYSTLGTVLAAAQAAGERGQWLRDGRIGGEWTNGRIAWPGSGAGGDQSADRMARIGDRWRPICRSRDPRAPRIQYRTNGTNGTVLYSAPARLPSRHVRTRGHRSPVLSSGPRRVAEGQSRCTAARLHCATCQRGLTTLYGAVLYSTGHVYSAAQKYRAV